MITDYETNLKYVCLQTYLNKQMKAVASGFSQNKIKERQYKGCKMTMSGLETGLSIRRHFYDYYY